MEGPRAPDGVSLTSYDDGSDWSGATNPWVIRDRLLARLLDATSSPVVVVDGPAGSGKSTLAAQWLHFDTRRHAFVNLAPLLDDPAALAHSLVLAFEVLGDPAPETRTVLTGVEPSFSAVVLPALTRLAGNRGSPYLLVVDDTHVLTNPQCLQVLAAVCVGVPEDSTVALLGRDVPPTWLARTRAEGRLREIGPHDLAFDADETGRLFAGLGMSATPDDVATALETSEGWPVALYLMALAERRGHSLEATAEEIRQYLGDYIDGEILAPLTSEEQQFLLDTAILDEVTPGACQAVTGRPDAARLLDSLHTRIQLVVRTGPDRYRYHHLLRESLQQRAARLDAERVRSCLLAAGHWYRDVGDIDAAIRFATDAQDVPLVSQLVWSVVASIGSGDLQRMGAWLARVGDAAIAGDRWLSLAAAWTAMQAGDGASMDRWAMTAERHAGAGWRARVGRDEYAASLAALYLIIGRPLEEMVSLGEEALHGLPPDSPFRSTTTFILGVAETLLRRLDAGRVRLNQAVRLARAFDVPIILADALSWLGVVDVATGHPERGAELIAAATETVEGARLERLASSAHCITAQAYLMALRGNTDAARRAFGTARRMLPAMEHIAPWYSVAGRLVQARTAVILGDGATARILVREAERRMTPDLADSLAQDLLDDVQEALRSLSVDGVSAAALTTAEMRVLQYMPSHLSFPEIGEHLFLSPNTVKTHALAIYRKFGVASRSEAVARARDLGLVDPLILD